MRTRELGARRRLAHLAAVACVGSLALAGSAGAATDIGSTSLASASTPLSCSDAGQPCAFVQDTIASDPTVASAPSAGVITRYSVRGVDGTFALRVFRGGTSTGTIAGATVVGTSQYASGTGADVVQTLGTRIPVVAGDLIGLRAALGTTVGTVDRDATTNLLEVTDSNSPSDTAEGPVELLLSARVEPDADGDGFGDETQDRCSSKASIQGACPVAGGVAKPPAAVDPLASLRAGSRPKVSVDGRSFTASKRGLVAIPLNNPNAYAVKGTLRLKAGRLKLGSKAYSMGVKGSTTVKVRLPARARRALARRKKLKPTATITAKGPIGKAGTVRRKLTIKAPAKTKKQGRAKGRDGSYQGCFKDRALGDSFLPCGGSNFAVRFEVRNGLLRNLRVLSVRATCRNGEALSFESQPFNPGNATPIAPDGSFFSRFKRPDNGRTYEYEGRVNTNGTASGKLKIFYLSASGSSVPDFCSTGSRPFTAKRR